MNKDKLEIINTILSMIVSITAIVRIDFESCDKFLCGLLGIVLILSIMSCCYWLKEYPKLKMYKFVRYLFFESEENKFNIAPKMLLFMDVKKKRNIFEVDSVTATYTIKENNGKFDSTVLWKLDQVSNVKTNNFYFYVGVDSGIIEKEKITVIYNNNRETIDWLLYNKIDSGNDIFLCCWNIPSGTIKNGNRIDSIELNMEQKNKFDFDSQEAIYLFPCNFGKKINKLTFQIIYPISLGKISIQLFEAGKIKGKKFPDRNPITSLPDQEYVINEVENTVTCSLDLNRDINMNNLYYILLHKRNENFKF